MPTYVKTGYWEKKHKGFKDWLNLDKFVEQYLSTEGTTSFPILQTDTLNISGKIANSLLIGANYNTPDINTTNLVFPELEHINGLYDTASNFNGNNHYNFKHLSFPKLKYLDWEDIINEGSWGNNQFIITEFYNLRTIDLSNVNSGQYYITNNQNLTILNLGVGIHNLGWVTYDGDPYEAYSYTSYQIYSNQALSSIIFHQNDYHLNGDSGGIIINTSGGNDNCNIDASQIIVMSAELVGNLIHIEDFKELVYGDFYISGTSNITLNFPKAKNLRLNVDSDTSNPNLISLNFPIVQELSLSVVGYNDVIDILPIITIPDSCIYLSLGNIVNNPLLTDIVNLSHVTYLSSYGDGLYLGGNAFIQSCVDAILAKAVEMLNPDINTIFGTIDVGDGTNATPSAAGLINVGILTAAGTTVFHN